VAIDLHTDLLKRRREILTLAASVEQRVSQAITALVNKDIALAREVRAGDDEINLTEVDIENECLRVLALTHPVAGDLRFIMAVLRINTDLERIGDKAKTIAKRVIDLTDCPPITLPPALLEMAQHARKMLGDALTALTNEDAELCRNVRRHDELVDHFQKEIYSWAHQQIPRDVNSTQAVIDILSISRALERTADMATNIAEDVIFLIKGEVVRHTRA
jgi:phosphate transport system protein